MPDDFDLWRRPPTFEEWRASILAPARFEPNVMHFPHDFAHQLGLVGATHVPCAVCGKTSTPEAPHA